MKELGQEVDSGTCHSLSPCILTNNELKFFLQKEFYYTIVFYEHVPGFPGGISGKEPGLPTQETVRDAGSIPGLGRSPGGGHGNPLQYSCLENPMDRGAWRATVHRVAQSWTRIN